MGYPLLIKITKIFYQNTLDSNIFSVYDDCLMSLIGGMWNELHEAEFILPELFEGRWFMR